MNTRCFTGLAIASALTLLTSACSTDQGLQSGATQSGSATTSSSGTGTPGPTSATPANPSTTGRIAQGDRDFADQATQSGLAEVQSSRLALTRSRSAQVKAFAQQMIDDHMRTNQELAGLAAPKGIQPPTAPSAAQRAQLQQLTSADAQSFDRQYVELMGVKAHQDTIDLFQRQARDGADPDLRGFAARTLPALQHHLQMAQQLRGVMMSQKSTSPQNG
jgi:putative membrane protein